MTKFNYCQTILLSTSIILLGANNLNSQYDDLYFDGEEQSHETVLEENEDTTFYEIDGYELAPYSQSKDDDLSSDTYNYEEYLQYQNQEYAINAFGFTNRLSNLRLSGFCLPRRYNYFELLRIAVRNPNSRFNAPFLFNNNLNFLSPFAPYRSFTLSSGEWALSCNVSGYDFLRFQEDRFNTNNFNFRPRSAQRPDDIIATPSGSSRRNTLTNGNPRIERSIRSIRTTTYRDQSSSRSSTAVSSYPNRNNNTISTSTSSTTSSSNTRATRRP